MNVFWPCGKSHFYTRPDPAADRIEYADGAVGTISSAVHDRYFRIPPVLVLNRKVGLMVEVIHKAHFRIGAGATYRWMDFEIQKLSNISVTGGSIRRT